MAALLVFVVFLVAIAASIPIGVSMILGSVAPIFIMDKGGSIAQIINNTFSGANSTPILAVPLFILGCVIKGDLKYGAPRSNPDGGICLHSHEIRFIHPVRREEMDIIAPPPESWKIG